MTHLPQVSGKDAIKALGRIGFEITHTKGSHFYMIRKGSGLVCVPVHANRDLPIGTFRSILRQAGITLEEFLENS